MCDDLLRLSQLSELIVILSLMKSNPSSSSLSMQGSRVSRFLQDATSSITPGAVSDCHLASASGQTTKRHSWQLEARKEQAGELTPQRWRRQDQ